MNVKGDANRSVRMTKKRLNAALVELLLQKPVQEITVRELTAQARVSRGTFYFHYADIYDLLRRMEQEQLDQLEKLMSSLLPRIGQERPPEVLEALFRHLEENKDVCLALYGPNGDPAFTRRVKESIARSCLDYMGPENSTDR
ncbi:MAG: TetR/AcrR family transcriptional regulator, partial [Gemmiger sp.]